jgi:hypothetical protein
VGDAAAPLVPLVPLALLPPSLLVPFGLPEMFSCETLMPVLFLQLLLISDSDSWVLTNFTSEHYRLVSRASTQCLAFQPDELEGLLTW